VAPNIAMIGGLLFGTDKPGKDTNSRGMIIFNDTLYITKGSGGNGINTVYQVGSAGTLPTGTAADLANVPITILPEFPNTTASTSTTFPFGIWFANETTLYVCDEGDGTIVSPAVAGMWPTRKRRQPPDCRSGVWPTERERWTTFCKMA
jgi:hypothetical protein